MRFLFVNFKISLEYIFVGFKRSLFKFEGILCFFRIDRTNENPFEWTPLEGIAKTISPLFTFFLSKIFFLIQSLH